MAIPPVEGVGREWLERIFGSSRMSSLKTKCVITAETQNRVKAISALKTTKRTSITSDSIRKTKNFQKIVYGVFALSVVLEVFHLIIPNRSFQIGDLIGNILGVLLAYFLVKIYLRINSHE